MNLNYLLALVTIVFSLHSNQSFILSPNHLCKSKVSLKTSDSNIHSFVKPSRIEKTSNYIESQSKSTEISSLRAFGSTKKKVVVIGGGLSGLSCAKYLADAGHIPIG